MNFGGIEEQLADYDFARAVIIPIPFDATSTWIKGADRGPEAILEASANMELFDIPTQTEVYLKGIHTMEPIGITDDPAIMTEEAEEVVEQVLRDHKLPIVIGGNHSVCIGPIRASARHFGEITVIQIDAHTDLRQSYEGSPLSHASVMARAQEVARVVQVGIRSMCAEELPYLIPERVFYAQDITGRNDWYQEAARQIRGPVYITIDLDGFDPSILPSTGTPEPGGLTYYEVYNFLSYVIRNHQVVGFDVNELCPNPEDRSSDFLASKLIYQLVSLIIK
ncbi:MAG: agmatinase [Bacteroidales bacterium]|nr:agmatinase [Bacteroidales bacterium]